MIDAANLNVVGPDPDDIRQGVLRSGHDVFDALEKLRATHLDTRRDWGPVAHLETARAQMERAARTAVPASRRQMAIFGAAHAIFAIELLDGEGGL